MAAAIKNYRDLIIQSAPQRAINPANAAVFLTASAPVFRVPVGGGSDPASISFKAIRSVLLGPVAFTATGATVTSAGDTATLTIGAMPGDSATVTATITENGQTFSASLVIGKIYDGAPGAPGAPGATGSPGTPGAPGAVGATGARGPGQYYASGGAWADATAEAATPGASVQDDLVTIYNGSTFSQTKRYNGSAWVSIETFLSGGALTNASLDRTKFANTIEPVTLVSSVPATKSTNVIFNTVTGKQYRWNGAAYEYTIPTADLTGTIPDSMIPALASTKLTGQLTSAQIADLAAAKLSGQIASTQITDSAISTPKLAAGAVVADKIAAGAVTTSKLLVASVGSALNADPGFTDPTAWDGLGTIVTLTDGKVGNFAMRDVAGGTTNETKFYPVDPTKIYRLRAWARKSATSNGVLYLGVQMLDSSGNNIPGNGTFWYVGAVSSTVTTSFTEFVGYLNGAGTPITAACKSMRLIALLNYGASAGYMEIQDYRIEEVLQGTQIADGIITTNKLVANAVTASKIGAGAVDTSKLLVTSKGSCLNDDPFLEDVANSWEVQAGVVFADGTTAPGSSSPRYLSNLGTADAFVTSKRFYALDPAKTYSLTANLFAGTANTRSMLIFVMFYDNAGAVVTAAWGGTASGYTYFAVPPSNTFTQCGGQFGAATARPIPANVRTCKVGVWSQYSGSGSGFAQHAFQEIRLELVSGSTLIADGAITTSKIIANAIDASKIQADAVTAGKIAAGAISAREITAGSILAKHLVLANKDDVCPDPTFADPSFWFPSLGGVYPTGVTREYNFTYPVSSVIRFTNVSGIDHISRAFAVEKGAVYRFKVTIYKDPGVSGNFTFTLHVPGVVYSPLNIPRTGTLAGYGNGIDWASVPNGVWTTYTGNVTASIYDYLDFRCWGTTTGGTAYIAVELVRASDASLIVDGAITASKITVSTLSAITAELGSAVISSAGSLRSGQTAYSVGNGWWLGYDGGVPKFSIGDANQYMRWNGTALEIKFPEIVLAAVSNLSSPSGANGTRVYGSRTATVTTGGTAPFTYSWSLSSNYLGRITLSNTNSATVTVSGTATNDGNNGVATCLVTDSNNLVKTVSFTISATHGSPP